MPSLPVRELPGVPPAVPDSAPAAIPTSLGEPSALAPTPAAPIPVAQPDYIGPSAKTYNPALPTTGERVIDRPVADSIAPDDAFLIDHEGRGTRQVSGSVVRTAVGAPRLLTLILSSGPTDDYALIPIADTAAVTVTAWIPDHRTGQEYGVAQEMVYEPTRALRIGIKKGLAPAGRLDVILTGG